MYLSICALLIKITERKILTGGIRSVRLECNCTSTITPACICCWCAMHMHDTINGHMYFVTCLCISCRAHTHTLLITSKDKSFFHFVTVTKWTLNRHLWLQIWYFKERVTTFHVWHCQFRTVHVRVKVRRCHNHPIHT